MAPRFCQSCGTEIPDNITGTCPKCGNPVGVPPDKTKSAFFALILSLVIPGLGQAYCGALLKAIGFLLSFTFCLSLFLIFDIGIGFYLFPIVWLIGIADAYISADRIDSGKSPWTKSTLLPFGILVVVVGILFFIGFLISAFAMVFAPVYCAPGYGCIAPLKGEPQCSTAGTCIYEGIRTIRVNNYGDTHKFLDKALSYDPHNATVYTLMGIMEGRIGNRTKALELFDQSLALDPNQSAVWNNRGIVAAKKGDTSAASTGFRNAVNANPNESVAWFNLGTLLLSTGDNTTAAEAFSRASDISPKNMKFMIKKGRMLNTIGDYNGAVDTFSTVTNSSAEYIPALLGKGEALAQLGRYNESCATFDAVIRERFMEADIWSAVYNSTTGVDEPVIGGYHVMFFDTRYGHHLSDNERQDIIQNLSTLNYYLKLKPAGPDSVYNLREKGYMLIELKRYDEAIDTYNTANSFGNVSVDALNSRGVAEFFKGDSPSALNSFAAASEMDPLFIPAWNNRAFVLWRQGQNVEAVEAYRHAIQLRAMPLLSSNNDYIVIVNFGGETLVI